jgi:hypothetical protein
MNLWVDATWKATEGNNPAMSKKVAGSHVKREQLEREDI